MKPRTNFPVLLIPLAATLLLAAPLTPAHAYEWTHLPLPALDPPVHDIQFDLGPCWAGGNYFVGTAPGVYRGDGPLGNWSGLGLDYPGLTAYALLCRQGAGWEKTVINEVLLTEATGVAIGDLDASGRPDVVSAVLPPGNTILWYENPELAGMPHWPCRTVDAIAPGAREVVIGDLDGDEDLDIAAALRDESRIVWYEARESTASPGEIEWFRHDVGALGGPRGVFIADIDADGHPDLVAGGMDTQTVAWFEAPDDPTSPGAYWPPHVIDLNLLGVKGIWAIDVDLDDDLDVVAAGRDAGQVVWYEQQALFPEAWSKHYIDNDLPGAVSVWAGDLTGDAYPEVAVTARESGRVMLYEPPADLTQLWTPIVVDPNLSGACALAGGDIDGDGLTDLVATGKYVQAVRWYRNPWNPNIGDWQGFVIDPAAGSPMGVALGDLDQDGDLDCVATSIGGEVQCYWNDLHTYACAFSDGTGGCWSDGIYAWHGLRQEWEVQRWTPRPYFLARLGPSLILPEIFFFGSQEGLFSSLDLRTWAQVGAGELPDTVRCIWFHPEHDQVALAGTPRGLYRTADAGLHWSRLEEVPPLPVNEIQNGWPFEDPSGTEWVFAALGNGTESDAVWRSLDGGESWGLLQWCEFPTCLIPELSIHGATHVLLIGTASWGIQRVSYTGLALGDLNDGLGCLEIQRLRYDPFLIGGYSLFAGTGQGLYACSLVADPSDVAPRPPRGRALGCTIGPNPCRNALTFMLDPAATRGPVQAVLHDLAGRRIWSGRLEEAAGAMLRWDGRLPGGSPAPPGLYFYRITSRAACRTGQVVRIR